MLQSQLSIGIMNMICLKIYYAIKVSCVNFVCVQNANKKRDVNRARLESQDDDDTGSPRTKMPRLASNDQSPS